MYVLEFKTLPKQEKKKRSKEREGKEKVLKKCKQLQARAEVRLLLRLVSVNNIRQTAV